MPRCKITVVKKTINPDLAKAYCQNEVNTCPVFEEGQEFVTGLQKPQNFCDWAWNDILRCVAVLLTGGNFSKDIFDGWMKDDKTMITCCTDGIRPVVFKVEKILEEEV